MVIRLLFWILAGYLSGSVLYAWLLPLKLLGIDITEDTEDGNPGVWNCVQKAGWQIGLAALLCDLMKGLLPVALAARAMGTADWTFALVMAAPVAGHAFSVFRHGRGGKSITTSFGVMLGLLPAWEPFVLLALCYVFFSAVVQLEPHRFRSIVTYSFFGLGALLHLEQTGQALGCVLISGIVIWRHWSAPADPEQRPSAVLFPWRRRH